MNQKEYSHQYYLAHRAKIIESNRQYYLAHRERKLETTKHWQLTHRAKVIENRKLWNLNNLERRRISKKNGQARLKQEVLTHYGEGKCACVKCGFTDIRALSIDHINGNGNKQRGKIGSGGGFYYWLRRNNYPEDYQTLCMNCQFIKSVENNECAGKIV